MSKPVDRREQRDEKKSDESGISGRLSGLTTATSPRGDHAISSEEARFYYYGLTKSIASTPRLIARSSTDPFLIEFELTGGWELPKENMKKRMSTVKPGSHSITSTYDSRLRMRIREILQEVDWRCIDIVRIGRNIYQDDNETAILITCLKDAKVDHTMGMRLVRRCQELLDECGLTDVHVEIKEGTYATLGREDGIREQLFDQVPCIGTSIGVTYRDGITMRCSSGTLGLYLRVGEDPVPYGLTCRRVVFPPSRPPPGGPKSAFIYTEGHFRVDAPSSADRQEEINDIEARLNYAEEVFAYEGGLKKLAQINQHVKDTEEFRAKLKAIRAFDSTVGTVYAASADNLSSAGGIRDWAIIKFNPRRLDGCDVSLGVFNKLPCPPLKMMQKLEFKKLYKFMQEDLHEEDCIKTEKFYCPIADIVPTSEIQKPPVCLVADEDGVRNCHPCMRVVKCGRTTGWTIAEIAGIRSDCQRTRGIVSTEIFIPDARGSAQFSTMGDSGSILLDFSGRAVGIIHGWNAIEGSTDNIATYATPIEDLLKDIEKELGVAVAIA